MIRLKEQKSIFAGLSMNVNSDGFSKSTKVDLQTISQISTRVFQLSIIACCLQRLALQKDIFKRQRTHAHSVFV